MAHDAVTYLEFAALIAAARILFQLMDEGYAWLRGRLVRRGVAPGVVAQFDRLRQLVVDEVGYLEQTVVRPAKDPGRPATQWTADLAKSVREQALRSVTVAGSAAIDELARHGVDRASVDARLDKMLEAAVAALRAGAAASGSASAAPPAPPAPPAAPAPPEAA